MVTWPDYEAWMLADLAEVHQHGRAEGQRAGVERHGLPGGGALRHPLELVLRRLDRAMLLLRAGRAREALPLLSVE